MKLQGRHLSLRLRGEDVKLLHTELRQLGFTIPDNEIQESLFGPRTEAVVKRFQTSQRLEPTGIVDEQTAALINREVDTLRPTPVPPFVVRGHVRHADGHPFSEGVVQAFDKDLRREERLGEARVDGSGFYEIRYAPEQFRRAEKKAADLIGRVLNAQQQVLVSSDIRFNAQPTETVDLVVDAQERLSEFERYHDEIRPLLEELSPTELKEDDIDFIAGETGIPPLAVTYYAVAHQHAQVTRIEPEVLYGLFRQNLPTNLPALLVQRPAVIRRALEASIQKNIIPSRLRAELERILAALKRQMGERVLRGPDGVEALPRLLGVAGLSQTEQESFLTAYLTHEGTSEEFWRSQQSTPLATKIQPLQATLQLGLVTQNNLPLIQALHTHNIRTVRDLPRLDRRDLQQLILESTDILAAIPSDSPTETNEQKATRYVEGIHEVLTVAVPTAFVRAAYDKSTDPLRRSVARVLSNVPELELRDENLDRFFADHPRAFEGVTNLDTTKLHLKKLQRAMRVAPHAEHAEALLAAGLDSAQSITTLAPATFEALFADAFGSPIQARAYYKKAQYVNASVLAITAAIKQEVLDITPVVIHPFPDSGRTLPNFSTLFGTESFCSCEHCGSVLSPAAYLVDLLGFINPKAGVKPIAALRQKRPDLEHIPLTCENTNTPLPYVDLVNEVLEFYVAHGAVTASAARDTTGMSATELSVNPQYTIDTAYQALSTAVYPQQLPFHRPLEVVRLYLEHLGVSRHQLMKMFRRGGNPSDLDIDLESLQVAPLERDILTGTTGKPLAEFYGYPALQDPGGRTEIKVSDFLARTALTYEELVQLLTTTVLNANRAIKLEDDEHPSRCDLAKTTLKNLTPEFWHKAHRVIRLRRKLGWSIREVDRSFTVFQSADVTLEFLRRLAATQTLAQRLNLPVSVVLSFFGDLDTQGPDALYKQLFLNRGVQNPPDPAFVLRTPEHSNALLKDHEPVVLAALRLTADDLVALRQHLGLTADQTPLSLSILSALHRHRILARVLKLTLPELLSVIALTGQEPFASTGPTATQSFAETVQLIKESGFTIKELEYLYRHRVDPLHPVAPPLRTIIAFCRSLQADLQKSQAAGDPPSDPVVHPLKAALSEVIGEATIEQALAIVDGTSSLSEAERGLFIEETFSPFLDPVEAKAKLLDPAGTAQSRREYLRSHLTVHQQKGLVIQAVRDLLGIESSTAGLLLQKLVKAEMDPTHAALHDFLQLLETNTTPEALAQGAVLLTPLAEIIRTIGRLHKAGLLITKFGFSSTDLAHLGSHHADFGNFDLNTLPLAEQEFQIALVQAWMRLARVVAFRKRLPQALEVSLFDVFAAAHLPHDQDPRQRAIEQLIQATGWNPTEVEFLVGTNGFNLAGSDHFKSERSLLPLLDCLQLSGRIGISCERLFAWASSAPDTPLANDLVSTVKAKYADEQWLAVAKPINDRLREKQKDALVSYILANDATVKQGGITNSNQLFEYFLIDVDMGACMKTSRIKQAISSVQLFIQRCLMNLEDSVSPAAIDAGQWEWMKNYRVWEANRKVFLYPENWIEPELRDDKSPFFKELETELLQNDLTLETAEQAFVHYLEKLDKVGRLEICGLYVQEPQEWGDEEVVHVFGRTKETPHVYYYRRRLNGRTWTPWEKVEMDIEGDHLIPVVHNRRLYLFWLHFEEKQDDSQQLPHAYVQSREHWRWLKELHPQWEEAMKAWRHRHEGWELWRTIKNNEKRLEQEGTKLDEIIPNYAATMENIKATIQGKYGIAEDLDAGQEPVEPKEPEEPAFSTPPPLTHWEVKLSWSEYQYGRWSAKKTSSEFVSSPHVAMGLQSFWAHKGPGGDLILNLFNQAYNIMPVKLDGTTEETIFSVYLPSKEEHFVRVGSPPGSKDLTLLLFRRHTHSENVLGVLPLSVTGYELLGTFSLHCGNKLKALQGFTSLDYESLQRPDGTTNWAMSFQHETGAPSKLTFTADGNPQDILTKLPDSGAYNLLYQHQHLTFQLRPPFQDFFYQDEPKTYFASYQDEAPASIINIPHHAIAALALQHDAPLVTAVNRRLSPVVKPRDLFSGSLRRAGQENASLSPRLNKADLRDGPAQNVNPARWGFALQSQGANEVFRVAQDGRFAGLFGPQEGLRFETFFHPHVCEFIERLYRKGIPALLSRETQQLDHDAKNQHNIFSQLYAPSALVVTPYPREHVDFGSGAYASYNWELFFHIPMLIATALTKNQRFEDALQWYHYIFNPMTDDPATSRQRYWNTFPFFNNTHPEQQHIQELLLTLAGQKPGWKQIEAQINEWLDNPFNPHLIARLRITAYQKHVVMKYLDNLIAWGDQLFSRDTLESINEATLLYVLAANVLGPRPKTIPRHTKPEAKTYKQLEGELDAFANTLVEAENIIPYQGNVSELTWNSIHNNAGISKQPKPKTVTNPTYLDPTHGIDVILKSAVQSLYFCVPRNEELLRYWDTVEDRLFKIRHCMNIEGVARELPLFEPPIDPALLVRAKAAGIDLGSVLNDLFAPLPHYRFTVMLQKALELCNELKSLSGAMLSALEKKDAETLSNLRAAQEKTLLKAIKEVKQQHVDEAKANIAALTKTRSVTEERYSYYRDVVRINANEQSHMDNLTVAMVLNEISQEIAAGASAGHAVPDFHTGSSGTMGSPVTVASYGGSNIGGGIQAAATQVAKVAALYTHRATTASIKGGYDRRWDDWKLQENLANRELDQLDKQIVAAEIRQAITEKEIENHEKQTANSEAVEGFLRGKYTNEDLYSWMIAQVSKVYFQAYKLTYDLAKRAERTFRHELGLQDSSFVQFGYWDNLKKGLLAGEQLTLDLKRMEAAYFGRNKRELELTKHISLAMLDPLALMTLRETGRCFFRLPEELFDLDFPGHYFRRIKSVSLTLPCVVGPYTTISCTVRLMRNSIRLNTTDGANGYPRTVDPEGLPLDDLRFVETHIAVNAIAMSTAQNDSGVFELSFRDERYLPFEGAGVISDWVLELFNDQESPDFGRTLRQFDYGTISDAILHVKYTAREDAGPFKTKAIAHLRDHFTKDGAAPSVHLFNLRQDFPSQWHRFQHPTDPATDNVFALEMAANLFPFRDSGKALKINAISLLARCTDPGPYTIEVAPPLAGPSPSSTLTLTRLDKFGGLHAVEQGSSQNPLGLPLAFGDKWVFKMTGPNGALQPEEVKDMFLVLGYEWE